MNFRLHAGEIWRVSTPQRLIRVHYTVYLQNVIMTIIERASLVAGMHKLQEYVANTETTNLEFQSSFRRLLVSLYSIPSQRYVLHVSAA